jgi:molybdate transport system substrate-binding protein
MLCPFLRRAERRRLRWSIGTAAVLALALALPFAAPSVGAAPPPSVAAAADLQFALIELAAAFRRDTGDDVRLSFGSSGNFAQQIANGAPFELFLSADEAYVERLAAGGFTRDRGTLYAVGRIALFVPSGSPLKPDASLTDLKAAINDGRLRRFAIANPEHAPYGRAAREALQAAGAWPAIEPLLVLGENASQATQFAAAGNAQGGIVPQSLALVPEVARRGTAVLLTERWHAPLRQRMVLLKGAGPVAVAFYQYLQTKGARQTLARYGFALPGEN